MNFTEEQLEEAYLEILEELGWEHIDGRHMEREDCHEVILEENLRNTVYSINKNMPVSAKEEAIRRVLHLSSPNLIRANEEFHKMLTEGINIGEYIDKDKNKRSGGIIYLIDFENINNNEFLAVNQFTIIGNSKRRPDILLYINGIPLVVIELKSLSNDSVGIKEAYTQIERYKFEISSLFKYNAFCVISDGVNAKAGTISSNEERYMSFRSVDGVNIAPPHAMMMEVLTRGMLSKKEF